MKHVGTLSLERRRGRVILTVKSKDLESGLVMKPLFGVRSLHFGTKLKGYNIKKGQGYGWDGKDYVKAKQVKDGVWELTIPVRQNDPNMRSRRFVKGNCYIRTEHNEIYYFNLRKWKSDPKQAIQLKDGGAILEIDLEEIPG